MLTMDEREEEKMAAPLTMSRREKFKSKHTLICLLQALQGRITTVELRNECTATGYIDTVDGFMNVTMSRVLFVNQDGQKTHMESFFVQGSLIRYVQVPDDVDMVRAIKRQMMHFNPHRAPAGGGRQKFRQPKRKETGKY
ncbi:U7 snRNA-associated Sm-like protein LSm10 [Diadema antillarum]|uniref:U7 snRNA-associated Sm-like protein LSm10 n=1 Tax=Diadema antillarum TaxID=105358 RepID=UPI003A84B430